MRNIKLYRLAILACVFAYIGSLAPAGQARRGRQNRDEWQQPGRVVTDLNLQKGDTVADIGAGRGYFTFRFAEAVGEKGRVLATEISKDALKSIDERVERDGIKNIETVLSDPTNTKLTSGSCDAAVIANVLHHAPADQRQALIDDIVRALKPGGFFYILDWRVDASVPNDPNSRIEKDELIKMAEKAGMKLDAEFHYITQQVFLRFRKAADE